MIQTPICTTNSGPFATWQLEQPSTLMWLTPDMSHAGIEIRDALEAWWRPGLMSMRFDVHVKVRGARGRVLTLTFNHAGYGEAAWHSPDNLPPVKQAQRRAKIFMSGSSLRRDSWSLRQILKLEHNVLGLERIGYGDSIIPKHLRDSVVAGDKRAWDKLGAVMSVLAMSLLCAGPRR